MTGPYKLKSYDYIQSKKFLLRKGTHNKAFFVDRNDSREKLECIHVKFGHELLLRRLLKADDLE